MPIVSGGAGGSGGAGAMALLKQAALAAPASSLSVSGIAGSYSTLFVVIGGIQSTAAATQDNMKMTFNNDSGAAHYGGGNANSSVGAAMGGFASTIIIPMPGTSGGIGQGGGLVMWIPFWNQSVTPIGFHGSQTGRIAAGGTSGDFPAAYFAGQWQGGAPIASIQCVPTTGPNWSTGAYIRVYGLV